MMQKYSQLLQIFGGPPFWRGQRLEAFSFSGVLLIGFGLDELVSLIIVISPVHLSTRMVTSRSSRHVRHVAPISPPFSARCAYFPSPRECTPSTVPKRSVIQVFGTANSFAHKQLPPLSPLFALFSALPSFVFNRLQPLFPKHPGWGYPVGWTKAKELVKVARRDGAEFACAPWAQSQGTRQGTIQRLLGGFDSQREEKTAGGFTGVRSGEK